MYGLTHKYFSEMTHRRTFLGARNSVESMVKLEKEKKQQVSVRSLVAMSEKSGLTQIGLHLDKISDFCRLLAKKGLNIHFIFEPKDDFIGSKWDYSGTFTDQISIHFGSTSHI